MSDWQESVAMSVVWIILALLVIAGLFGFGYIWNHYDLWAYRMKGQQELVRAEGTKKIAIEEALAKRDSAKLLAEAEIIRAQGVAEANKIIGDSLRNNETYLKYLWITQLDHSTEKQVIYIPTEANMPILEAGRNTKKRENKDE